MVVFVFVNDEGNLRCAVRALLLERSLADTGVVREKTRN
jgi:hypothetical protein